MTQADRVIPKSKRETERARRAPAWAPAACVLTALLIVPGLAEASQPPSLPGDTPTAESTTQAPSSTAAPALAPEPATAAPPTAPPPRVEDGSLSLRGSLIWDGLQDKQIQLVMADGSSVRGTVVAQTVAEVALARASDGMVVSVPKSEVQGIKVRPELQLGARSAAAGPRPTDSGRGLRAGGVAMLTLGSPLALAGTVWLGLCPYCLYINLPLLLPGIGLIVGGSIALKRAKKRNEAFRQAWGIPLAGRLELTPSLALSRSGGHVGFNLRF